MGKKNKKLNIDKDILYDFYINKRMTSNEVAKIFNCTSKSIRNYLTYYNIPIRQNSDAVKLERSKWTAEKEANRSKKYIETFLKKSKEEIDDMHRKRVMHMDYSEVSKKSMATKLKNGSYKKSKLEDCYYNKLKLFVLESDIIRGYYDDRYPFNCDFYIKSKDLFIELQGHQTHGSRPYNVDDDNCIRDKDILEKCGYSIDTLVRRDPYKLDVAKNNKIKLLLIYPNNDSFFVSNGDISNIGKFNIAEINDFC